MPRRRRFAARKSHFDRLQPKKSPLYPDILETNRRCQTGTLRYGHTQNGPSRGKANSARCCRGFEFTRRLHCGMNPIAALLGIRGPAVLINLTIRNQAVILHQPRR
jgi:hypothetical protein